MLLLLFLTTVIGQTDCPSIPCKYNHKQFVRIVNGTKMDKIYNATTNMLLATCHNACISHDNGIVVHCGDHCYYDPCVYLDYRINPYFIKINSTLCTIKAGHLTYCSLQFKKAQLQDEGYSEICFRCSGTIHTLSFLAAIIAIISLTI